MNFGIAAIVIVVLSSFSQMPALAMLSYSCLYLAYALFWRENEPKVIFFAMVFFWLTIPIKLVYADIYDLRYEDLSVSPNIVRTTYLSLVGYIVFSLGIHLMIRKIKTPDIDEVVSEFKQEYNADRVVILYLISFAATFILSAVIRFVPGLFQFINGFLHMKLAFIFLLTFSSYVRSEKKGILFVLLAIEVALSFVSVFSNFKDILITLFVSLTIFKLFQNRKMLINVVIVGSVCLYTFLLWQAVKNQYRQYILGGRQSQVVVVDDKDALKKLFELMTSASIADPALWYNTVDRLSYIEFFSQATDNVPRNIPYENGLLWRDNVSHIFMPRILFPAKKAIDDSELVNKYCTEKVAGAAMGTTFSLGFMAESYIDFGPVFMFVPIFLLGILIGFIYRKILYDSINIVWGYALVTPLWVYINVNGTPGTKVLGYLVMYLLAFIVVKKYVMKPMDNFILKKTATEDEHKVVPAIA